jgi:hypothetical protein
MSFGRDDSRLATIGGYGASPTQQMNNAMRRQQGPRKGAPSWANNYRPSEHTLDNIRFLSGNYNIQRIDTTSGKAYTEVTPWFEYTEHYHGGTKRSAICSAGVFRNDKKQALPCRGCEIYWEDWNERNRIAQEKGLKKVEQPNRISRQDFKVFNILDMGHFFKGTRLDDQGRPITNKSTGRPIQDWVKYIGPHQDAEYHTSPEKRQGLVLPFPVGFTQFQTINGYAEEVQKNCRNCGGTGSIYTQTYVCPQCGAPTLQGHETTMPPDKIKDIVNQPVNCLHCRTPAYPRPVMSCQYCPHPTPARLFDVDIQLKETRINNKRQLIIASISPPRPIDPLFQEIVSKPVDLVKKFAETPYEEQLALFGAPAPQQMQYAPQGGYGYTQPQYQQGQQSAPYQPAAQPYQPAQYSPQPQYQPPPYQPPQYQPPQYQQPQPQQQPQQPQQPQGYPPGTYPWPQQS